MSGSSKPESNPVVDVCGKRTLEYVVNCLGKFNRGANVVTLRSIRENIIKAVEVARILYIEFGIEIANIQIKQQELNRKKASCIEIFLRLLHESKIEKVHKINPRFSGFVEFPVHHLLFDSLLFQKGQLNVCKHDGTQLITILTSGWGIKCKLDGFKEEIQSEGEKAEERRHTLNDLNAVFYRCGLLISPKWNEIAEDISQFDDVILGLDTDIIMDAVVSEHLLNSLSLTDRTEYVHTPNWLLLVAPASVMHEIEMDANSRDQKGNLTRTGRLGYRSIQEILELESAVDMPGVSLIITGEANPILDTRVELQGLRADFSFFRRKEEEEKSQAVVERLRLPRLSSGDTIIRDQFKQFLRQINFHKGVYFLTADKSNVALAKAEGLHPVYYKFPAYRIEEVDEIEPPKIPLDSGLEYITLDVPLGKLIYELAVQFGSIKIVWDGDEIEVGCDSRGESLDHWIFKDLFIKSSDLRKLLENYEKIGRFFLPHVISVWNKLSKRLYGADEAEVMPESILSWMIGNVESINHDKKFGFVRSEDGIKYFFHSSCVRGINFSQLKEYQPVKFIPDPNPPEEGKLPRILELRPAELRD